MKDVLFDHTPQSFDAERALLACLLMDPDCLDELLSTGFRPEFFVREEHRAIFNAILAVDSSGALVEPVAVVTELQNTDLFEDTGKARQYIKELADMLPSTLNVQSYKQVVEDKFYKRSLIQAAQSIYEESSQDVEPASVLLDSAEQRIYDIRNSSHSSSAVRLGEVLLSEVFPNLENLSGENRENYMGIGTGWSKLDGYISGLNRSDLVIIGARPGMGKTAFAMNMAVNVAKKKKKVLFVSLEMQNRQLAERAVSMEARIQGQKMRTGRLSEKDWTNFATAAGVLNDLPLYFVGGAKFSVNEVKAITRRMKNVDIVFIDYLQLLEPGNHKLISAVERLEDISRSLKMMAMDFNIPVVALCQLNRNAAAGKSHKPQMAELKGSGAIEQDADIILMLHREDYYEKEDGASWSPYSDVPDCAEIIVEKNRHGPTGIVTVAFNKEFMLFSTLEEKDFEIDF